MYYNFQITNDKGADQLARLLMLSVLYVVRMRQKQIGLNAFTIFKYIAIALANSITHFSGTDHQIDQTWTMS